jgi:hypothetical protein
LGKENSKIISATAKITVKRVLVSNSRFVLITLLGSGFQCKYVDKLNPQRIEESDSRKLIALIQQ